MVCSLRVLNRYQGEALHMCNIVFYFISIVEMATRSLLEYSTGSPRVSTSPLYALLTSNYFFLFPDLQMHTLFLLVTRLIHEWEI